MIDQPRDRQDAAWSGCLMALLTCAWLFGVPFMFLRALVAAPWWGPVTDVERASAQAWTTAAVICAAALPASGFVFALMIRRKSWLIFFATASAIGVFILGAYLYGNRHSLFPAKPPAPEPTHCVERSGGGNECPGD